MGASVTNIHLIDGQGVWWAWGVWWFWSEPCSARPPRRHCHAAVEGRWQCSWGIYWRRQHHVALYCWRCHSQSPLFFLKTCRQKHCCCCSSAGNDSDCTLVGRSVPLGSVTLAPVSLPRSWPWSWLCLFFESKIDRYNHDECDDCVCPVRCKRMALSAV